MTKSISIYLSEVICFFFNDTATTEIYTLSLHDALPISAMRPMMRVYSTSITAAATSLKTRCLAQPAWAGARSEEHTSELQSRQYLVCRLLLEKKKLLKFRLLLLTSTLLTIVSICMNHTA